MGTRTVTEAHREALSKAMKGKVPKVGIAGSLAVRKLRRMGLTRDEAPDLYIKYRNHFLSLRFGVQ